MIDIESITLVCDPAECEEAIARACELVRDNFCQTAQVRHGPIIHVIATTDQGPAVVAHLDMRQGGAEIKEPIKH